MSQLLRGLVLIGVGCLLTSGNAFASNLKQQLALQHFSGVLQGDVTILPLGALTCGSKSLRVVFYEWVESSPPGEAVHSSHRLIFLDGSTYIGSYSVEDRPTIRNGVVRFPYKANGNSISCGATGGLPEKVLLDGEIILFEK